MAVVSSFSFNVELEGSVMAEGSAGVTLKSKQVSKKRFEDIKYALVYIHMYVFVPDYRIIKFLLLLIYIATKTHPGSQYAILLWSQERKSHSSGQGQ